MAKNMQPILKRCKALGISPAVMGVNKETRRNPKQGRRKQSEYAIQLNEKQKAKFIYGVLEKQFRHYYEVASNTEGVTGENLLQLLERRLDNVVYRLGFANTRREARQMVNHGHIVVNGKRVDIPSYQVTAATMIPKWLELNRESLEGKVVALSERSDIDFDINETLIVELYSK